MEISLSFRKLKPSLEESVFGKTPIVIKKVKTRVRFIANVIIKIVISPVQDVKMFSRAMGCQRR